MTLSNQSHFPRFFITPKVKGVYTTAACAAPGLVIKTEACTWMCPDNRSLCWPGLVYTTGARAPVPEFIDPRFLENKPKTLVFSHRKQAYWAWFRENWVYNFRHWTCLDKRSLCCTWTGLYSVQQEPWSKCVQLEIYKILNMGVFREYRKILSNYATRNSADTKNIRNSVDTLPAALLKFESFLREAVTPCGIVVHWPLPAVHSLIHGGRLSIYDESVLKLS